MRNMSRQSWCAAPGAWSMASVADVQPMHQASTSTVYTEYKLRSFASDVQNNIFNHKRFIMRLSESSAARASRCRSWHTAPSCSSASRSPSPRSPRPTSRSPSGSGFAVAATAAALASSAAQQGTGHETALAGEGGGLLHWVRLAHLRASAREYVARLAGHPRHERWRADYQQHRRLLHVATTQ